MTKNKDELDKNDDGFNKWDLILANIFVIMLAIGLLIAGMVVMNMAQVTEQVAIGTGF